MILQKDAFHALTQREQSNGGVFFVTGHVLEGGKAPQIPKQKSLSVKQSAFESICTGLSRPAGRGILQGRAAVYFMTVLTSMA